MNFMVILATGQFKTTQFNSSTNYSLRNIINILSFFIDKPPCLMVILHTVYIRNFLCPDVIKIITPYEGKRRENLPVS